MSLDLILFAANAGMNYLSAHGANKIAGYGQQVEQSQFQQRLKQEEISTLEQSVASAKELRTALGANAALMGMRGQLAGSGSALAIQNENVGNYYNDKAVRNLNLEFKKNDLKLQGGISALNAKSDKSKRNTEAFGNLLNSTSFNTLFGKQSGRNVEVVTAKPSFVRR